MPESGYYRRFFRPELPSLATWLMVFLLFLPTAVLSNSVPRLVNANEESCQQTVVEELKEEARLEIYGRDLVHRTGTAEQLIAAQQRRGVLAFFCATATRPAEHLATNGCGAPLRC